MVQRQALIVYQWGVRAIVELYSWGAVAFGLGLIWGGPVRFGSPGLATARELPGEQYTWGGLIAACGLVALAGIYRGWHRPVVMAGIAGVGVWFMFFAVTIFTSFLADPHVPTTGFCIYGLAAATCFILCAVGRSLPPPVA